jgi:uncharacterized membrane protein (UPF0136 family)
MPRSRPSTAGGVLLALGALLGTAIGYVGYQPIIGLIAGLGTGTVLAVAVWILDRRR